MVANVNDVDSGRAKIVKISEEMSMALKHTDRGNDPLSIINKTGVVVIGEGNLSFTFALGAYLMLDEPWDVIKSTIYEKSIKEGFIAKGRETTKKKCKLNFRLLHNGEDPHASDLAEKHERIDELPPLQVHTGVDAEKLYATLPPEVLPFLTEFDFCLWFQCPWVEYFHAGQESTFDLVGKFLSSAYEVQTPGSHVMVGIMNIFPYVQEYHLEELFSHSQYKFVGYDDSLITEVLHYGYKYQSRMRLNGAELSHITLVFEKRGVVS